MSISRRRRAVPIATLAATSIVGALAVFVYVEQRGPESITSEGPTSRTSSTDGAADGLMTTQGWRRARAVSREAGALLPAAERERDGEDGRAGPPLRGSPDAAAARRSAQGSGGSAALAKDGEEGRGERTGASSGALAGAQLSRLMEAALEEGDLGALQGLLISGLTLDGTRLNEEDLPALFDALVDVKDYGLQKLIVTHLERIEGSPQEMVDGYLDYLEAARKPVLADEVFKQLVKVGGDEAFEGLASLVRDSQNEKLRREAALALGELKDPRGARTLHDALLRAQSPQEAKLYTQALAKVGGKDAISLLVDYAARGNDKVALSALRDIRDPAAGPILSRELNGRVSQSYQLAALRKIGSLRDPRTLYDLERFIDRAEGSLLKETITALSRFQDRSAAGILERFAARNAADPRIAEYAMKASRRVLRNIEAARRTEGRPPGKNATRAETRSGDRAGKAARKAVKKANRASRKAARQA